jgi:hypothetical protein
VGLAVNAWQQANALTTAEARKVWGLGGNYQLGIVKVPFGYLNKSLLRC